MASRFTSQVRRFSRLCVLVAFAAIGLSCAVRSMASEFEWYAARNAGGDAGQILIHLHRAATLWPYDYPMRTSVAYYWAATRFYEAAFVAIPDIKAELAVNPYAADLWQALASYSGRSGDYNGAADAMMHLYALRRPQEVFYVAP